MIVPASRVISSSDMWKLMHPLAQTSTHLEQTAGLWPRHSLALIRYEDGTACGKGE